MRRRNNQDNFSIVIANNEGNWQHDGHLLIVADGMGAHAAGELASKLSVELIPHHYAKLNKGLPSEALQRSFVETNLEIYRRGQANPEFRNMGTTTSALAILPEGAVVAHVGDSRVYRLRDKVMEQLTFDHSLVWEMRASGDVSEEALKNNTIPKNVITRSLGPNASVAVDLEGPFPLRVGDKYLLCSDGLSGQLLDEELGVLLQVLDIETAVQAMIEIANLRSGPDNITVVVGEVKNSAIISQRGAKDSIAKKEVGYPLAFGLSATIGALAAVALLVLGQFPIALIAGVASLIAFVSGWIKFQSQGYREPSSSQYGRGPYRHVNCKPDAAFSQRLHAIIVELREWVTECGWKFDATAIDEAFAQGTAAEQSKRFAESISRYVSVILLTMAEARKHQNDSASDSSIEY